MPRKLKMAVSFERDISSHKNVFRGFEKSPLVLLNRLNLNPLLTTVKVKHDKNGFYIPCSEDDQGRVLRDVLTDCTVDAEDLNKDVQNGKAKKIGNNKIVIGSKKRTRGRPRKNKVVKPTQPNKYKSKRKNRKQRCYKCMKTFENLNAHKCNNKSKKEYICSYCSKIYVRETFFQRHIELHCKICFAMQRNESLLVEHVEQCKRNKEAEAEGKSQPVEAEKYICELCTDQFKSKCVFAYHKAAVHSENPPSMTDLYYLRSLGSIKVYVCYFCKEGSVDKDYLEAHVRELRNMTIKIKYPCEQCVECFDTDSALLQHKSTHLNSNNLEPIQNETSNADIPVLQDNNVVTNDLNVKETNNINNIIEKTDNSNNIVEKPRNTNNITEKTSDTNIIEKLRNTNNITEKPSNSNNIVEKSRNTNNITKKPGNTNNITEEPRNTNNIIEKPSNTNNITEKPGNTNIVEKSSIINNITEKLRKTNNIIEKPSNIAPLINATLPSTLQNVKREAHIQSTVQKEVNQNTNINRNRYAPPRTQQTVPSNTIMRYHCKMCEKFFFTNFALLRHMKVHHVLRTLSCQLCKQVLSNTSQLHDCPKIKRDTTKSEADCIFINEVDNVNEEFMDTDCPVLAQPQEPQAIPNNINSLQERVINIVLREVPIEF